MNTSNKGWYLCRIVATLLLVGGILTFSTHGFTSYTYESVRRADVAKTPVTLSDWQLQDSSGEALRLNDLGDDVLLVDFIYTRCPTICRALGSRYSQLQKQIDSDANSSVTLLSVSIDPDYDKPKRLWQYRQRHGGQNGSWRITRPQGPETLQQMLNNTGIRVIADGWGGFAHSDSIHVIKNGKLVNILDWDSDELTRLIGSPKG